MLLVGEGGLLDFNPWTILWAWVTFAVTVWALSKVAWPLLQTKMEERENRIREGLKRAEEAERRARELMERQEEILQEARDEAGKLLTDSRAAAENIKRETLAAAQNEIGAQRDRAKKEIDLERARAVHELKRAAVDLTLEAAGRVLERELKDEDHRRLAADVISRVESLQ
ncbi:MAG: F0F1 ATP synthase subunit B [Planctomycetota bacterium]|jgi:F-type H+-transporting ATPase subunit b